MNQIFKAAIKGVFLGAIVAGLGACSSKPAEAPAPPAVPVAGVMRVETMAQPVLPLKTNPFVCGQQVAHYRAMTGQPPGDVRYSPVRILPPNAMVTMDFNPERLNIDVDENGKVTGARCG